jgi:alanine dehydrogenase
MQFVSEDVASRVVSMAEAIEAVEAMFRDYGRDMAEVFPVAQGHGPGAGTSFSIKSGLIRAGRVVGLKVGSYWPDNRLSGLAAHASTTLLLDPDTGYPKALVAASHLTSLRTAASDAVAVRHLSREDSRTLALFGAGHQAWFELLAVREVRPIETVLVANRSPQAAASFARRIRAELGLEAQRGFAAGGRGGPTSSSRSRPRARRSSSRPGCGRARTSRPWAPTRRASRSWTRPWWPGRRSSPTWSGSP